MDSPNQLPLPCPLDHEKDERRPLPEALDAVAEAAAAFKADADKLGQMLDEVRAGWAWKLFTAKTAEQFKAMSDTIGR